MHKHPRPLSILTDPYSLPAGMSWELAVGNNKPGSSSHIISLFPVGFFCFFSFARPRLCQASLVYKISSICFLPERLLTLSLPVTLEISLL